MLYEVGQELQMYCPLEGIWKFDFSVHLVELSSTMFPLSIYILKAAHKYIV